MDGTGDLNSARSFLLTNLTWISMLRASFRATWQNDLCSLSHAPSLEYKSRVCLYGRVSGMMGARYAVAFSPLGMCRSALRAPRCPGRGPWYEWNPLAPIVHKTRRSTPGAGGHVWKRHLRWCLTAHCAAHRPPVATRLAGRWCVSSLRVAHRLPGTLTRRRSSSWHGKSLQTIVICTYGYR